MGTSPGTVEARVTVALGMSALALVAALIALVAALDEEPSRSQGAGGSSASVASTTAVPATTTTALPSDELRVIAGAPTTMYTTTTTAAPTTTTAIFPTTTLFKCQGLCTHIESVSIDVNGELTIAWTAHGFEPATNNFHAHFYYNIYTAGQVGSNFSQNGESSQGSWVLTDQTPFQTAGTNVAVSRAPEGATAICVTVADSGHGTVSLDNAECVDFAGTMMGQVGG